ncbi:hypothetical protein [Streptomyces sp. NPDC005438]|uniref:hypothetical protein n=1 Tax=Streptomyces sp. NPDC005438 TaxID=3156880 RepID=UPI0033BBE647
MGRHERELTARAVEMAEVARQLRLMRDLSGLTYARLSLTTGLSVTQLHRAANGWRTPWPVVEKFALGCGADPLTVQQQWQDAMATPEAASFGIDRVRGIATMEELREAMQELFSASGLSLRQLSQRAPVGMLPRTTLNDALRGCARLRRDLVEAFIKALQLGTEQETAWVNAWQRASRGKTLRRRTLQLTPSPRLLQMLADIDMPQWNCLATFVDRALDEQVQAHGPESGPLAPSEISISFRQGADTGNESIVVRDQGAGMNQSELIESVRLNWTRGGQTLTGLPFNIAMHRLGSVVTVRTARRQDTAWSVLTLNLRSLLGTGEWTAPLHLESKQHKDEHGTEITISDLRPPTWRPREWPRLHRRLGDVYGYLIREGRLRLTLDGCPVAPRLSCAWDPARSVHLREGPVAARQEIDVTLATVQRCQDCEEALAFDADACGECGGASSGSAPPPCMGLAGCPALSAPHRLRHRLLPKRPQDTGPGQEPVHLGQRRRRGDAGVSRGVVEPWWAHHRGDSLRSCAGDVVQGVLRHRQPALAQRGTSHPRPRPSEPPPQPTPRLPGQHQSTRCSFPGLPQKRSRTAIPRAGRRQARPSRQGQAVGGRIPPRRERVPE